MIILIQYLGVSEMGKKRCRSKKISKGERVNVNKGILKSIARDVSVVQKELNKILAWKAGKNPWITISNPSNENTKERTIRVRANSVYGSHKNISYGVNANKERTSEWA